MTSKNIDNNKYCITVKNRQTTDTQSDTITEKAYGSYTKKNNKIYITYTTDNDDDKTSTLMKLDGDEVFIKRLGSISSAMTYKSGTKKSFMYRMPYGNIEMENHTHRIVQELDENGGSIRLVYTLIIQGEKYFNDMEIKITKR